MMLKILHNRSLYIFLALTIIVVVIAMMIGIGKKNAPTYVSSTIEIGDVRQLVSVSGIAEAEQTAELSFPTTGIIESVLVKEGEKVIEGQVLMTLESKALAADRLDALAALARVRADRDELLAGPSSEARDVTNETLSVKTKALATTIETENQKVTNAKRSLLSSNLSAFSDDDNEDAVPPTISGTYNCLAEGVYTISVFSSGAQSGYSYRLSGIESGTYIASVEQAIAMGDCGLRIKFDSNSNYGNTTWTAEIPNTKASTYTSDLNIYNLAVTQAESAISLARQEVALAEATAQNNNAPARIEAVARANADVAQAQARLARIDATLADRVLTAPFSGTITNIELLPGETVTTAPVITLLASSDFQVVARIPEIDIGKLLDEQKVEMIFDARDNEILTGRIDFISLKATEIDGVAYYEATIKLDSTPTWLRSGLNADIEIIIEEAVDALRVPKRFVTNTNGIYSVLTSRGEGVATTTIEIVLEGNDGFYALTGLNNGDTVVAPE